MVHQRLAQIMQCLLESTVVTGCIIVYKTQSRLCVHGLWKRSKIGFEKDYGTHTQTHNQTELHETSDLMRN